MQDNSPKPSDREIIRQILDGNVDAFESLLLRYGDMVLGVVKKHVPLNDVEETVQEVFLRVFKSLSTFMGKSEFKQWLSSIAIRTCYDYWRKAYRSREIPMSSLTEKHREWLEGVISVQSDQIPEEIGMEREARELLDWALGKLSAEERMVLELIYLEGLSCRETADLLGWSVANVKVRSFRSRKKIEKLLKAVMKK